MQRGRSGLGQGVGKNENSAQYVVAIAGDDLKSAQGLIGCFGPHPSS